MILVFDIESVPDVELLKDVYGYEGDNLQICKKAFESQKGASGSEFLPLPFHKIISIASLMADEYGNFMKIGHFAKDVEIDKREEILLRDFSNFLGKWNPKLVTFNGRGFDIPLVCIRSLKYNINLSWYYENENQSLNKTKWDNYMKRYSDRFHIDLLDILGNYGATRNLNLDALCKMCGLLGKYDVCGSQVYELIYKDQDIKKVDFYCESDVLNTYLLYLKFELTRGLINISDYIANLKLMCEAIKKRETPYKDYFADAISLELEKIFM